MGTRFATGREDLEFTQVTVEEAKVVLAKALNHEGLLDCLRPFVMWKPGQDRISLDGKFTADQLEAMTVLMRNG